MRGGPIGVANFNPGRTHMFKFKKSRYIKRSTKDSFFVEEKKKRPIVPLIIIGAVFLFLILFSIVGLRYGEKITVDRATVVSAQIPESFDGFKILHLSDLHGKEFGENQKNLLKVIEELDYDMVVFTGDYSAKGADQDLWVLRDLLAGLKENVPIYYVLGDCDYTPPNVSDTSDRWKMCIMPEKDLPVMGVFREYNGMFVYPAQKYTNAAGDSIYLTSISYDRETLNKMDFDQEMDFSICVTHKPINYNVTRRLRDMNKRTITEVDYDLCLSGHTLGGQVRVPILGALYSEEEGFFPQETSLRGISKDDAGRYTYINAGLGVENGFRFFSNPEVSIIELKRPAETAVED